MVKNLLIDAGDAGDMGLIPGCGVSVGFLTRYDRELREPLLWRQGSQVSMCVARGCVSFL